MSGIFKTCHKSLHHVRPCELCSHIPVESVPVIAREHWVICLLFGPFNSFTS